MPMSASCVVNRAELLDMLGEVREALPGSLAQAQELLGGREQMVAEARQEAQRIIDAAHNERGSLISGTEVARRSQQESDRILAEARKEAADIRAEADDYVDSKLANFEVVLSKTIGSVDRGRDKLLGRTPATGHAPDGGVDAGEGAELDELHEAASSDPEVRRQRAEEYIEAQFRAFEAVLAKTLQAVGRGRQKLTGYQPTDELGAHMVALDGEQERSGQVRSSDADYLAGLAETPAASAAASVPEQTPPPVPPQLAPTSPSGEAHPPQPQPCAVYQQEAHPQEAYPQDSYAQGYVQDAYGNPQQPVAHPGDATASHASYGGQQGVYGYEQGYQAPPQENQNYQAAGYPEYVNDPAYPGYSDSGYAAAPGQHYQDPGYQQQAQPYQPYADQGLPPGNYDGQYAQPQASYDPQLHGGQPQSGYQDPTQQPSALDETSLFDTSMLDMEQLRRYEQGR